MANGISNRRKTMLKAWRKWRNTTNLGNGTFLKFYIYDRMLIRPRRKVRRLFKWWTLCLLCEVRKENKQ